MRMENDTKIGFLQLGCLVVRIRITQERVKMATVTIKIENARAVLEDMEIEQDYSVKSLKEYENDFF